MTKMTHRRGWRQMAGVVLIVSAAAACVAESSAPATPGDAGQAATAAAAPQDIRHLAPAPDSVGPQPTRFAWSPVDGVDDYTLRVWNEADVRIISESGLTDTSIEFPAEYELPFGTYFWAVVGMRGGRPVAESGLAAFVVKP